MQNYEIIGKNNVWVLNIHYVAILYVKVALLLLTVKLFPVAGIDKNVIY